jgi:hypothetical protein
VHAEPYGFDRTAAGPAAPFAGANDRQYGREAAKVLTGADRPAFREPVFQDLIAPTSPNAKCRGK